MHVDSLFSLVLHKFDPILDIVKHFLTIINMRGKLIVIDGIDGSGKTTQTRLLCDYVKQAGMPFLTPKFPRYEKESSCFVRQMLQGGYEKLGPINPHVASMFYGLDRMDAALELREFLEKGQMIICDRYTSSNIGHQGGRIESQKERKAYYSWLDHFEYEQLHIPRPDAVMYLHVPVEISIQLIEQRLENGERQSKDIYERDIEHLQRAYQSYREAAELFPYWHSIECMDGDRLMSPEEIHGKILEVLQSIHETETAAVTLESSRV